MKFTYGNSVYEVLRMKPSTVKGWTHFAEVKRVNGKKRYCANIMVAHGGVITARIIG
jgi:hypothetical protein